MKRYFFALILLSTTLIAAANRGGFSHSVSGKQCGRVPPSVHGILHSPASALDDLYASSDTLYIPDYPGDTVESVIHVGTAETITDVNVSVNIRHSWMRDLRIALVGPDDTTEVLLLDRLPMDSVADMNGWFDDQAGWSVLEAEVPLIDSWRPIQPLSVFNERSSQGNWKLRVLDRFDRDSGYVAVWRLNINSEINIRSVILDSLTRAPVRGSTAWIVENGDMARTNDSGVCVFSGLSTGSYTLMFAKSGYETLTVADVVVPRGSAAVLDTAMQTVSGYYEFASTARTVAILDLDSSAMAMNVNSDIVITDLDVTVNLTHQYLGDLDLYLKSPSGTIVQLLVNSSTLDEAGLVNTRFDDESAMTLAEGWYPYRGRFRPAEPLSAFDSSTIAGLWTLITFDRAELDTGSILNFTLQIMGEPVSARPVPARPSSFAFQGCFPNPFNAGTEFRFDVFRPGRLQLTLYDLLGRKAAIVAEGWFEAGSQSVVYDAHSLASGLYFAELASPEASFIRKVVLLK